MKSSKHSIINIIMRIILLAFAFAILSRFSSIIKTGGKIHEIKFMLYGSLQLMNESNFR